jgi:hypothetical protein
MIGQLVTTELNCIWEMRIVAQSEVLFQHLPSGTEEHHEKPQSEGRLPLLR